MWFSLFGDCSSSSGSLGWAALFYCGPPLVVHIIVMYLRRCTYKNIMTDWNVNVIKVSGYIKCVLHDIKTVLDLFVSC